MNYWTAHAVDKEYGGYTTCLDRRWKVYNQDKSIWFQGRGAWMFSRLFNEVEKKEEWLEAARTGIGFLDGYGFDTDGRMYFQVTRDGKPLVKRRYVFSETFAVIAYAEYYRASGDETALLKAKGIFDMLMDLYNTPGSLKPKVNPEVRPMKGLALPMILLSTARNLCDVSRDCRYADICRKMADTMLKDFYKPGLRAMLETIGPGGETLDTPQGRCVNPGHSIEAAWFMMHEGLCQKDEEYIRAGMKILEDSLELGWDKEYGGIFSFIDIEGKPAEQLEWDMKLWWPHTETLYALLLAYDITRDEKYAGWYETLHEYAFSHFEDKSNGEWFGYLHRDGSMSNTFKGSMWKGMFHLPRALLLNYKLLDRMLEKG